MMKDPIMSQVPQTPPPEETAETEQNIEELKNKAMQAIRHKLGHVHLGTGPAPFGTNPTDVEWRGAPNNLEAALSEIKELVEKAMAEHWPKEQLEQAVLNVKLTFDKPAYSNFPEYKQIIKLEGTIAEQGCGPAVNVAIIDTLYK